MFCASNWQTLALYDVGTISWGTACECVSCERVHLESHEALSHFKRLAE